MDSVVVSGELTERTAADFGALVHWRLAEGVRRETREQRAGERLPTMSLWSPQ